jgi:hypothetical protein
MEAIPRCPGNAFLGRAESEGGEMTNPFEAAIEILQRDLRRRDRDLRYPDQSWSRPQIDAAIRVLEAAGSFTADDKERLEKALDQIPFYTPISDYKCPGQVLRDKFKALLSAIPDKEPQ